MPILPYQKKKNRIELIEYNILCLYRQVLGQRWGGQLDFRECFHIGTIKLWHIVVISQSAQSSPIMRLIVGWRIVRLRRDCFLNLNDNHFKVVETSSIDFAKSATDDAINLTALQCGMNIVWITDVLFSFRCSLS